MAAKAPAAKPKKTKAPAETAAAEPRGGRKVRQGVVVSNKMQKTVVILIERQVQHPLYAKIVLRSNKFKAHDEEQICDVGDTVEIMETRPISKEKRWRVTRIIQKVK